MGPDHTLTKELSYCDNLIASVGGDLAYARVDIVPINGNPTLMELELIDPSLFFNARPAAADLLAEQVEMELSRA